MKKALISGITGQDGSYLAEDLVAKGYEVHGLVRRASDPGGSRWRHLARLRDEGRVVVHAADLSDRGPIRRVFEAVAPDEFYHLAGQSHVGLSFDLPESTFTEVAASTLMLLEICRDLPTPPRFYHAGSSEIFGEPRDVPQNEHSAFLPGTPYGCAKTFAVNLCRVYREAYGLFVSSGIAYNHESIRRGENFVTRKIALAAADRAAGRPRVLELGNLNARRDWGYAPEFVDGIWRILQHGEAGEFILATGRLTSLRDFVSGAFREVGIGLEFRGEGTEETAIDLATGELILRVNPRFFRPVDPCNLVGDPSKAARDLGWRPGVTGIDLAARLVADEMEARSDAAARDRGESV